MIFTNILKVIALGTALLVLAGKLARKPASMIRYLLWFFRGLVLDPARSPRLLANQSKERQSLLSSITNILSAMPLLVTDIILRDILLLH